MRLVPKMPLLLLVELTNLEQVIVVLSLLACRDMVRPVNNLNTLHWIRASLNNQLGSGSSQRLGFQSPNRSLLRCLRFLGFLNPIRNLLSPCLYLTYLTQLRTPLNPSCSTHYSTVKITKALFLLHSSCLPPFLLSLSILNSLNPKVEMTSTCWGIFPLFKASPSWKIRLGAQSIRIDEDVIELIRKDPLHVWGWYDAEIAQAWSEIASAAQVENCLDLLRLTDMVWLQEISLFWNFLTDIPRIDGIHCPLRVRWQPLQELRFVQFLEEVYCATLPVFEEQRVLLSTPIHFNWVGNQNSLKLA